MSTRAADPRWLLGAVPAGVACIRGTREIVLGFDGTPLTRERIVALLAEGIDAPTLAALGATSIQDATAVLELLEREGLFAPAGAAPASGMPLAAAIRAVLAGDRFDVAWTADEALLLGAGHDAATARAVLAAFVRGLRPSARLDAYAAALCSPHGAIAGDVPDAGELRRGLAGAGACADDEVRVVRLADGAVTAVAAADLERLGFHAPHRLGPLRELRRSPAPGWVTLTTIAALHVPADLRRPRHERERRAHGSASDVAHAELVARAEAAERYALGDTTATELVRARRSALDGAVAPATIHRWSARQRRAHAGRTAIEDDAELLWAAARTPSGEPRWVPAAVALGAVHEPAARGLPALTSAGAAAHTSVARAAEHAVLELIERDAFMWTWVQHVARERLDDETLPADGRALLATLRATGRTVDLVNLSLETCPVILAVTRDDAGLLVTAAARPDAGAAATRALQEAMMLAASVEGVALPPVAPADVRTPRDHLALHRDPDAIAGAAFLTDSRDVIDVREIPGAAAPLDAVTAVGEPLLLDLSSPATAPFTVVRAIVPGLVPQSFGFDQEPLGLAALAAPRSTRDGRILGATLDLEAAPPIAPHPFA